MIDIEFSVDENFKPHSPCSDSNLPASMMSAKCEGQPNREHELRSEFGAVDVDHNSNSHGMAMKMKANKKTFGYIQGGNY